MKEDFANSDTLAPLARQDDATLLAWQDHRVRQTLESLLLPRIQNNDFPKLVILVLPTRGQLESLSLGGETSFVKAPQSLLRNFCAAQKIQYFDASDWLQQPSPQEVRKWYLDTDQLHFNAGGHAKVADHLWSKLEPLLGESQGR